MFPGISGAEFFVLLLVLVVVVGPQRLPEYTRKLTQGVRKLRVFLDNAKTQIAEEVGPELSELDLSDLDPRNYDPRKIVRDALGEDLDAIRRDLTNPFQSVVDTAKEASNEAAAAVSGKNGNKSKPLSKMIEDKAEETRAARAASAQPQAGADGEASDNQEKDPQQAAVEAAAVTAELPQVDAVASTEEADTADAVPVEEGSADAVAADSAQMALESGETVTAEIPEVQQLAESEDASEEPDAAPAEANETDETEESAAPDSMPTDVASGESAAVDALEAAMDIPSTLESERPGEDDLDLGQSPRPVSPRDIVRAANEAARTRTEAATVASA